MWTKKTGMKPNNNYCVTHGASLFAKSCFQIVLTWGCFSCTCTRPRLFFYLLCSVLSVSTWVVLELSKCLRWWSGASENIAICAIRKTKGVGQNRADDNRRVVGWSIGTRINKHFEEHPSSWKDLPRSIPYAYASIVIEMMRNSSLVSCFLFFSFHDNYEHGNEGR